MVRHRRGPHDRSDQSDLRLMRTVLRRNRVVHTPLGPPSGSGKNERWLRQFVPADSLNYLKLEDPQSLWPARPSRVHVATRPLKGLVVIDEIERRTELFPLLSVLAGSETAAGWVP